MGRRSQLLAERLEQGAGSLATLAESLSESEWRMKIPHDGRSVGVIVHHVGNMYPIEIQLAQGLAAGKPMAGVTWDAVADINAKHAKEYAAVSKPEALEFLRKNSKAAAEAIRAFTDEQLDTAATVSLNADAPLTAQFFLEDHAVRHSFHHLAKIRSTIGR
ncbi:MAG: DinB family protein [bacterium]